MNDWKWDLKPWRKISWRFGFDMMEWEVVLLFVYCIMERTSSCPWVVLSGNCVVVASASSCLPFFCALMINARGGGSSSIYASLDSYSLFHVTVEQCWTMFWDTVVKDVPLILFRQGIKTVQMYIFCICGFLTRLQFCSAALYPPLKCHVDLSGWVTLQAIWAHQRFIDPNLPPSLDPPAKPLFSISSFFKIGFRDYRAF